MTHTHTHMHTSLGAVETFPCPLGELPPGGTRWKPKAPHWLVYQGRWALKQPLKASLGQSRRRDQRLPAQGDVVCPGQVASEGQALAVILCQGLDEVRHGGAHMPSPHSHPRTTCDLEKLRLSPHPEVSPLISRHRSSQEMLPLWPDDIDWGKTASIPEEKIEAPKEMGTSGFPSRERDPLLPEKRTQRTPSWSVKGWTSRLRGDSRRRRGADAASQACTAENHQDRNPPSSHQPPPPAGLLWRRRRTGGGGDPRLHIWHSPCTCGECRFQTVNGTK